MSRKGLFLLGIVAFGTALAQQYRWTDENGVVRYTDTAPPKNAKNVQKLGSAATAKPAEPPVPFEVQRLLKDFPVTLYTSPPCKDYCELAREVLNKRGIPFKEVQVWDQETSEELKRVAGAPEVPVLTVGRSVQRGFDKGAYDNLLDGAGYPKEGAVPPGKQKAPEPPEGYTKQGEAEGVKPAPEAATRRGRYDPSGLVGPAPKPGIYDPSGLVGPPPKPGPYDPEKQLKK